MSRFSYLVSSLAISVTLVACAGNPDGASTESDEVNQSSKVSGFDLDGPKALSTTQVTSQICVQIVPREQGPCEEVHGTLSRANGCKNLCSLPIAADGKAAGYDFDGYKQASNANAATQICPEMLSEEETVCRNAHGVVTPIDACHVLCSKPIARQGKMAGYDLTGFKILPNEGTELFCPDVVSPVREACTKVHGETTRGDSCRDLCSLSL
jgi:hypothetical protein